MSKVLVVEDDPPVRDVVEDILSREGVRTVGVRSGEEALGRLREEDTFDLVILDLMLPGIDGFSVCREIRVGAAGEANKDVPAIMLTARDDETSVVVGLEVGADDYITKPFSPRVLVSRVRAHLRRRHKRLRSSSEEQLQRLKFPGLEIDLLRREVVSGGEHVCLTAMQFELLTLLASHPGRVYSREQIMSHLWKGHFYGDARAADVHVQHIRQKVEPDPQNPRYLHTVRGIGYKFTDPGRPGRSE